ncbi:MAG: enoyl-CoA hydratase/isomerase family protein [Bacteroidetes bacterium]|nr:MAG: enoyl-CoA hydratase/isomerase family protein [Bacteroidota bacterium]MBL1145684.1 enoyl-CoA hydratase/isomerase family protein [Bacteroidota bacterium]NOG58478.1 enoyl-CoA hydratase/isomerase family protein [Bacteroidota bacterium]
MEEYVKIDKQENGLATIEFFHPKHNSLPSDILSKLAQTITEAGEDDAVKLIVLKSGGERTFCSGASFTELISINDLATGKKFFSGFANVINACRKCPKLIIGRVQGKAVGGGVGVASAVDYCLATKFASVKLSELNVGIGPFVVGPAVERKVGISAMSQMTINADHFYSADWAKEKGLYADVFEDIESLDEGVQALVDYLLSKNPEAQKLLKGVFWEGTEHWDDLLLKRAEMSGQLVLSDYTKDVLKGYA